MPVSPMIPGISGVNTCHLLYDLSSVFKTGKTTAKKDVRPISILSGISNDFERFISKQITSFINPKLSKLLCGFREYYSSQDALFRVIEQCRKILDSSGKVGMVLMDLSKPMTAFLMIYC